MVCSRCGLDMAMIEQLSPRYCMRCGERLIQIKVQEEQLTSLNVDEVANLLGISKASVYQYVRRGNIPAFHIGRSLRFDKKAIESLRGVKA